MSDAQFFALLGALLLAMNAPKAGRGGLGAGFLLGALLYKMGIL